MKTSVRITLIVSMTVIAVATTVAITFVQSPKNFRPKWTNGVDRATTWTNELVQIATGAISNPPSRKSFDMTNFIGSAFVDYPWNGATNDLYVRKMQVEEPTPSMACAHAYKSGVDSGYVLGRIMASRETVRMYVRAYSDPSLADAAAMMAVRDANAATAFRLEEANALSEARKIIQESTNTTNHAP